MKSQTSQITLSKSEPKIELSTSLLSLLSVVCGSWFVSVSIPLVVSVAKVSDLYLLTSTESILWGKK